MKARRLGWLAASLVALATAHPARAADDAPRDDTLSLPLVGLFVSSLGVQYERRVAPAWSVATSMAVRRSGGDDFDVWETGFGVEGRYWLTRGAKRYSRGPYFGARLEYGLTSVTLHGRAIGNAVRVGESASFGWRWVFWDRFELTPAVGFGARTELDSRGRLPPWTRTELFRFATTAGVVF